MPNWKKEQIPGIYCVQEIHFICKDINRLKVKCGERYTLNH